MIDEMIKTQLCAIVGADAVLVEEPMSKHTTFRIGGPADYFVCPTSAEQVAEILRYCTERQLPWFLLGNGSNLLVHDDGFRGVVIQLDKNYREMQRSGNQITVQAGVLLSKLAAEAREASLAGFEFASGIPGTFGGAVTMNAGAYGGEMKHVLKTVDVLDPADNYAMHTLSVEELELGYRTSVIKKKNLVVLGGTIELQPGDQKEIIDKTEELREARTSKQPLEYPSAGSTFKRPEGYFAGKLIMDAGLRGYTVGGAQVSEKHCGFVINRGGATAQDVCTLIEDVKRIVEEKFAVTLEPEIRFLGF